MGQSDKYKHHPTEYFKHDGKYSEFDDKGIPTKYKNGNVLKEKARKKLTKFLAGYTKKYNAANAGSDKNSKGKSEKSKGQNQNSQKKGGSKCSEQKGKESD